MASSPSPTPSHHCGKVSIPMSIDSDITGNGVVANYVVSAGFAVLLIIVYFLVVYDPLQDPFREEHQHTPPSVFRPNPVDVAFLRLVRLITKRIFRWRGRRISARIERIFTKCILSMSDLQILTGLSILISGFVQLSKGLSAYHWMVIVDLAWFSSLTHLACLTLLRNFLYHRPVQRAARLFLMGVLAILLVVGLSFTGSYTWLSFYDEPPLSDPVVYSNSPDYTRVMALAYPALCQLTSNPADHPGHNLSGEYNLSWEYSSMLFSIILIVLGFLGRIFKLYKFLSVDICARPRLLASVQMRRCLRCVFSSCCLNKPSGSLRRTILYRPLLTISLVVEIGVDWWSSLLLEVSHSNMWNYLPILSDERKEDDWGFGQVIAVLLLMAPLVTILNHLGHGIRLLDIPCLRQAKQFANIANHRPIIKDPDDPDNDWTGRISTISLANVYIVILSIVIFGSTAGSSVRGVDPDIPFAGAPMLLSNLYNILQPIFMGFTGLFGVVLFSLTIEADLPKKFSRVRQVLRCSIIVVFTCSALLIWFAWGVPKNTSQLRIWSVFWFPSWVILLSAASFYIIFAITYRVWGSGRPISADETT
ncbi:hypothetical protein P168DRAFT_275695 [Aspergillus campestris IBT 28561]|uniref:Uncharacterized protein n=1 Tax=Aspergillus campestris (strain IBT 28561) TaxID=1392248 RepID=A0A2I1CS56_ASPC2|nr:uncharacterized protein P168DRAFT_275695 [Aspergillus campestris IBT 28561]PKY00455.1 hypothetical protein P168DRAFT_275695 [Aspergillus campestris IBT 28561]